MSELVLGAERWKEIQAFCETAFGKLLLLALFYQGLDLYNPRLSAAITGLLFLFTFVPARKEFLLLISNLTAWIFLGWIYLEPNRGPVGRILAPDPALIPMPAALFNVIVVLVSFAFFALMLGLSRLRPFSRFPITFLVTVFGGLFWIASYEKRDSFASIVFSSFVLILVNQLWYIAYNIVDQRSRPKKDDHSWWLRFASVSPFWSNTVLPVSKGPSELLRTASKNSEEATANRLSGLKLLYWCLILAAADQLFEFLIFAEKNWFSSLGLPTLALPNHRDIGLAAFNAKSLSWWMVWIAGFGDVLHFLIANLAVKTGVAVAIARFAGFRLFRHSYKPLQSRSFNDFYRRIQYHYNELLVNFFFYPVWDRLAFLGNRRALRMFLSVFLSVFTGGVLIHWFGMNRETFAEGFLASARMIAHGIPYFIGIGTMAGFSAAMRRVSYRRKPRPLFSQCVFIGYTLVVYTVLLAMLVDFRTATLADRWRFLLSLVGW